MGLINFQTSLQNPNRLSKQTILINSKFNMVLSKQAEQNRPKKPLNTYMRFMVKRSAELGETKNKRQIVKKQWSELQQAEKDKLKEQVEQENKTYEVDMEAWRNKYDVQEEDEKRKRTKSKKKKDTDNKDDDDDQHQTKAQKTKGDRKKKQKSPENKKKEQEKDKKKDKDNKDNKDNKDKDNKAKDKKKEEKQEKNEKDKGKNKKN